MRKQENDTKEVKDSSAVGDKNLQDKIEAQGKEQENLRKEDKQWVLDELGKIRGEIEKRRLDDKEIFQTLNSLSVGVGKIKTHLIYIRRKVFKGKS